VANRSGGAFAPETAVHADENASSLQGEVQVGDVTEADHRLGIGHDRVEVDAVDDPVGARPTAGGDDGAYVGVAQGVIEVGESVGVPAGHVAPLVKGVVSDLRLQPPCFEDLAGPRHPLSGRETRRRYQPNPVAGM
jgi:hypothetical protein